MKDKMIELAQSKKAGTERAQCYSIADSLNNLSDNETIAEMMIRNNACVPHALRNSELLVEAGLSTYQENKKPWFYGTFTFVDDSELSAD